MPLTTENVVNRIGDRTGTAATDQSSITKHRRLPFSRDFETGVDELMELRRVRNQTPVKNRYERVWKKALLNNSVLSFYQLLHFPVPEDCLDEMYDRRKGDAHEGHRRGRHTRWHTDPHRYTPKGHGLAVCPDYLTNLFKIEERVENGERKQVRRQIIVDPHSVHNFVLSKEDPKNCARADPERYCQKLIAFRRLYPLFYNILVSDVPEDEFNAMLRAYGLPYTSKDICDEYVYVPSAGNTEEESITRKRMAKQFVSELKHRPNVVVENNRGVLRQVIADERELAASIAMQNLEFQSVQTASAAA